ncbi:MAG: hypothetical protein IKD06_05970 [Clostridia bacterium]|nr:hypothetical protein [Clostridia bacterium]
MTDQQKAQQLNQTLSAQEREALKKAYAGQKESLNKALSRAMQGEAEAAQELRRAVLSTPQGRQLLERLQASLKKP